MKKIKMLLLMVILLSMLVHPGENRASEVKAVSIGTSSIGSTNYIMGVGFSKMISKHTPISANVEPTGGSGATLRAIRDGKVMLGLINTLAAYSGFMGQGEFSKEKPVFHVRLMLQGHPGPRIILVKEDSGINSIEDLAGKTIVGKRRTLPDIGIATKAYLKIANVPEENVKIVETKTTNETLQALKRGSVAAVVVPMAVGSSALKRLATEVKLKIISVPKDKINEMQNIMGPSFQITTLPPKAYFEYQNYEVIAPDVPTIFVSSTNLPENAAYQITKAILDNFDELKSYHRSAKNWNAQNTLKSLPIPLHEGAIKYFKEKGLWTSNVQEAQKKLLDSQKSILKKK